MSRICIVTQSAAFASSAGMRVRYDRFIAGANRPGVEIVVEPIADILERRELEADAYIFCKTFTPEAVVLAHAARRAGRAVGHDLFDDYFSQREDQRLFVYRDWMRQMAPATDFAICGTERMKAVVQPLLPNCPIHLVEDPVIGHDPFRIAAMVSAKAERARASGRLRLAWFGIGDNPFFPVGLQDLTSPQVAGEIDRLKALGWDLSLTIATNTRALDADGLAGLRRLPIQPEVVEWTEEVETEVLAAADVAIIPVNSQAFSRAKSLNRALTALEQGCQVLSLGEPLYARLSEVIYDDVDRLSADLRAGTPRLNADSTLVLTGLLRRIGNAFEAGNRFVDATLNARRAEPGSHAPLLMIHGRDSSAPLHKLVNRFGGLSVRSPYSSAKWAGDIRFDLVDWRMVMRVSEAVQGKHGLPLAPTPPVPIGDRRFVEVDAAGLGLALGVLAAPVADPMLMSVGSYRRVMETIAGACRRIFPGHHLALSEKSGLRGASPEFVQ